MRLSILPYQLCSTFFFLNAKKFQINSTLMENICFGSHHVLRSLLRSCFRHYSSSLSSGCLKTLSFNSLFLTHIKAFKGENDETISVSQAGRGWAFQFFHCFCSLCKTQHSKTRALKVCSPVAPSILICKRASFCCKRRGTIYSNLPLSGKAWQAPLIFDVKLVNLILLDFTSMYPPCLDQFNIENNLIWNKMSHIWTKSQLFS